MKSVADLRATPEGFAARYAAMRVREGADPQPLLDRFVRMERAARNTDYRQIVGDKFGNANCPICGGRKCFTIKRHDNNWFTCYCYKEETHHREPATPAKTEVQEILRAFQRKDEVGASPACRRRLDFSNPASGEPCLGTN